MVAEDETTTSASAQSSAQSAAGTVASGMECDRSFGALDFDTRASELVRLLSLLGSPGSSWRKRLPESQPWFIATLEFQTRTSSDVIPTCGAWPPSSSACCLNPLLPMAYDPIKSDLLKKKKGFGAACLPTYLPMMTSRSAVSGAPWRVP